MWEDSLDIHLLPNLPHGIDAGGVNCLIVQSGALATDCLSQSRGVLGGHGVNFGALNHVLPAHHALAVSVRLRMLVLSCFCILAYLFVLDVKKIGRTGWALETLWRDLAEGKVNLKFSPHWQGKTGMYFAANS